MAPPDTFFRSSDMSLVQFFVAAEIGREVASALGELGNVMFRDLNADTSAFQRTFTKDIRRLENVDRQLRFFEAQCEKNNITVPQLPERDEHVLSQAPLSSEIDDLAERSGILEQRIQQLNESYEHLQKRYQELLEFRYVLRETGVFFDRAHGQTEDIRRSTDDPDAPLLADVEQTQANGSSDPDRSFQGMNIGFITGVIPRERISAFERILWRTLRGNLYMNQTEIADPLTDPTTNEPVNKNVFVIFAHGKEIIAKIRKIGESLGADLYAVDEDQSVRREQIHDVNTRIEDLSSVLSNTRNQLFAELRMISGSLMQWMVVIKKEKATYGALNLFNYDNARKCLIAEGWVPTNSLPLINTTLRDATDRAGMQSTIVTKLQTTRKQPTFVKTNKFTLGFQTIIDAYGTGKYQEINPGVYAIVTFPFLFAVMFGDVGHGMLMLIVATYFIYNEKKLARQKLDDIVAMLFYGRYIALVMGAFSIYTGLLYNDVFSKSMTLFTSGWVMSEPKGGEEPGGDFNSIGHIRQPGYTYPFGLDWAWHGTENNLLFTNSLKMKMSIVLGFIHMTYALILSFFNYRHFKSKIDIYGNFLPSFIFMQSIFGYLVFCILYKWSIDWPARNADAPGILNLLINMFLSPGKITERLYSGQKFVQITLLLIALTCVPILLLLKPLYLRWEHNKHRAQGYRGLAENTRVHNAQDDDEDDDGADDDGDIVISEMMQGGGGEDGEDHEEFEFSEVMIHQVIHTIEFCLNCISHTASYLRLWALSLAHSQLSTVLWNMTLALSFGGTGIVGVLMTVMLFYMWFSATCVILVMMEGTSAMLHSLRLHWVESMSKHFIGEGKPFEPFSFKIVLEEEGLL